jgi:cysteine desulfurase / selenocysteine lyase
MTIKTPTSSAGADPVPPAGFPGVDALARLANEFFAALPGGKDGPAGVGGLPGRTVPVSAPTGSPSDSERSDPSSLETPGAAPASLPGLPSKHGASESLPAPSGVPHGSPYYFLGESSAYRSAPPLAVGELPQLGWVTPLSLSLPGEQELRSMVEGMFAPPAPPVASGGPVPFYFLETKGPHPTLDAPSVPAAAHPAFDVYALRRDFPILAEFVNGKPLIWLDNAATTQKPQAVIDRLAHFYAHENSNIHRAAHELAARATDAYEGARSKVARFLGASSAEEIVFVRGATEGINLVAKSWGLKNLGEGDEIVVTWLEHHANIVPWQQLAQQVGATLRVAPVDDRGQLLLDEYQKLLTSRTRLVSFAHVSNALGTITPAREIIELAHRAGATVLVDGAQAVSHMRTNVQTLDADFYVFSGHKTFGPTGIGAVYGKRALLDAAPPWQGGGNMIADVTFHRTTYREAPARFEAGTPNIADAAGLGVALDYLERVGLENVERYEHDLLVYAIRGLEAVPGLRLIGTAPEKASVLSFVLDSYTPEEVGQALNREGIAVRAGHHCAQPILRRFGAEATVRPSLAFYNTCEEVDALVAALDHLARNRTPR